MAVRSPHGFIIFIPVFLGCQTCEILKYLYKMTLGRKGKVVGNIHYGFIRITQKVGCLFYFLFPYVVTDGNSQILLEHPGKVILGKTGVAGKVFYGDTVLYMSIDVINALHNWLGKYG